MNTKRSYLENLNAGRQRRSGTPLEEISRTLNELETRLERALDPRERATDEEADIARRMERLSDRAGIRRMASDRPAAQAPEPTPRATLERIARQIETTRRQEDQLASIGSIAAELQSLREEMRGLMSGGLRGEFDAMREELARVSAAAPHSPLASELNAEFERLSDAIERLASRSDDQGTKMLRLELEQVKASLANLAREETVRALDRRWDAIEDRFSGASGSDPAFERLGTRLEEISAAVSSLPESLSLASLDERVRALAAALDDFAEQRERNEPDLYAMVEERLDEISRAITASAALAHSPSFDRTLLERIEARITSLASQLDEVAQDRPDGLLVERINALSERVDQIAQRIDIPEQVVERLATHMAKIADALETVPRQQEADDVVSSLESRFLHLSELIERRQEDAIKQGRTMFHDLERRLFEMAERLDRPDSAQREAGIMAAIDSRFAELSARIEHSRQDAGDAAVQALEARLEDISARLQSSASAHAGIDSELIRNLELQVASLAEHLSKPTVEVPDFEDIGPRLEKIERSISENRAAVLEAARKVAEEAVEKLSMVQTEPADNSLRHELQNLEALTRKSDERNTKTFEAIHDTLLKIVDRLGSLEAAGAAKVSLGAPSAASDYFEENAVEADEPFHQRRTPAEAAAAAAEAALMDDAEADPAKQQEPRKVLASLSRAFASRRIAPEAGEREEPTMTDEPEDGVPVVDADHINDPLEPGSGVPDLNAIIRRVRDQRETRETPAEETAKADFIAAARRAAQAAAAEAEFTRKGSAASPENTGKGGLSGILSRRKKQLMLTLGVAIILAGGVHFARTVLDEPAAMVAQQDETGQTAAAGDQPKAPAERAVRHAEALDRETAAVGAVSAGIADTPMARNPAAPGRAPNAIAEDGGHPTTPNLTDAAGPADVTPERTGSVMPSPLPPVPAVPASTPLETTEPVRMAIPDVPSSIGPVALRQAAADGDPAALYEIANRYAEGRGVPLDREQAAKWYEIAAEQGLAPAQYRIGHLYEKGSGVERDVAKAKMWYELAAEQGNASAMHNLGVLYAMGAEGPANNQSAARWFLQAAEYGVTDSQFNLGILAARGAGLPQDLTESYKWFDIAARSGDPDAAAKRDEIAKSMDAAELARAQEKAKLWTARQPDPEANTVELPAVWQVGEEITASVDMKRAISNVQAILNQNGYDAGPPDGVMGGRTRNAIRAFQKANGLAETGEIDDALVRALLQKNESSR